MAENTTTLVTLDNLSDHTDEIKSILQQVRAYIDKQDSAKVDKVSGKGLSTNDLTTELLNKLNSLENYDDTAVRNLIKGISSRIDTLVGESATEAIDNFNEILAFLNGVTDTQTLQGLLSNLKAEFERLLANKVDKVSGKQLSTNDYTTAEKTKLSGIEEGANNYFLPPASGTKLGGVKTGSNITNTSGTISLTKANVTAALGFTPPTQDTTYGNATQSANGLMSSTDKTKLDGVETGAQKNTVTGIKGNAESSYRTGNVNITPANIGAAAASHTHKMSEITDLSIPTYETLTLTVTAEDGSSVAGQKATINGEVYPLDSTGVVVAKIPFGVQYDISLSQRKSYKVPKSETFIASNNTRQVSMIYQTLRLGVFIQDKDGVLYDVDEWDMTNNIKANGVALITEEIQILIALVDSDPMAINCNESSLNSILDITKAKTYYNGEGDTAKLLGYQPSVEYAAGWCNKFLFPDGRTKGYLMSSGESWLIYLNNADIENAMAKCGGKTIYTSGYWTSTYSYKHNSENMFWANEFKYGNLNNYNTHTVTILVRPIAKL